MKTQRVSRRNFLRFVSHGLVAGALSRTFLATKAFGAEGRLKLLLLTTPNGHFSSEATREAFTQVLSPSVAQQASFLEGLDFAATINESGQGVGDWHGGESALLSFNEQKFSGPSFYTSIPNLQKTYLDIGVGDRVYARDSSGGQVNSLNDPALALQATFGGNALGLNSYQSAAIRSGKMHVLDPCLDDIRRLRRELGSDGAIFDDYLYALQQVYRKYQPRPTAGEVSPLNPVEGGSPFEAPGCTKSVNLGSLESLEARHEAMLDIAYQLMVCDASQVVVLSFLNNNSDPQHQYIHGDGSNDGGAKFRDFVSSAQSRIAGLAEKLGSGPYNVLDRSALIYMSEGGAHFINGRFDNGHPQKNIPCAIFGQLGGAIAQKGIVNATGQTNRNLWRYLADVMAGGQADLGQIGGDGVTPMGLG